MRNDDQLRHFADTGDDVKQREVGGVEMESARADPGCMLR